MALPQLRRLGLGAKQLEKERRLVVGLRVEQGARLDEAL